MQSVYDTAPADWAIWHWITVKDWYAIKQYQTKQFWASHVNIVQKFLLKSLHDTFFYSLGSKISSAWLVSTYMSRDNFIILKNFDAKLFQMRFPPLD